MFGKRFFIWIIFLLLLSPMLGIVYMSIGPSMDIWADLFSNLLGLYLQNTAILGLLTVGLSLFIGTSTAWIICAYNFPLRKLFSWMLVFPMVIPSYIVAYIYTDIFDYSGAIQAYIRNIFDWSSPEDYWFFDLRSIWGGSVVISLVSYPYIYLFARVGFLEQCSSCNQACKVMGKNAYCRFFKMALPMAKPMIYSGCLLVFMEVLGDFGVSEYFSISTLSIGLYDTWILYGNVAAGAQLSLLLIFIAIISWGLQIKFQQKGYYERMHSANDRHGFLKKTSPLSSFFILLFLSFIVFISFLLPLGVIAYYSFEYFSNFILISPDIENKLLSATYNALMLAGLGALITAAIGAYTAYFVRLRIGNLFSKMSGLLNSGYALPGVVVAFGVSWVVTRWDYFIVEIFGYSQSLNSNLLLSGTVLSLLFAYSIRFIALPQNSLYGSLKRVSNTIDDAGKTMGHSSLSIIRKLLIPLTRRGLLTAYLLVFIEIIKELPITLLLRPFNFETLSTYVYQFASDEQIELGAPAALIIILIGMISVVFFIRKSE